LKSFLRLKNVLKITFFSKKFIYLKETKLYFTIMKEIHRIQLKTWDTLNWADRLWQLHLIVHNIQGHDRDGFLLPFQSIKSMLLI